MPNVYYAPTPIAREQIDVTARGMISETYDFSVTSGGTIPAIGTASASIFSGLLGLRAGDVVTNLHNNVTVVGTSLTFAKLGLFTAGGTFLGATASVSASYNVGTGIKTIPLTTPYRITADGGYYVGYLAYGSGATGATLSRSAVTTPFVIGSGARSFALTSADKTDISADVSWGAGTAAYWFAVS